MKLMFNGEEIAGGGVSMEQVNAAIDSKLENVQPEEVYSTEEMRIGTWIDGKPLYRKVLQATTPSKTGSGQQMVALPENVKQVVKGSAWFIGAYNETIIVPYYDPVSSAYLFIYFRSGYIYVTLGHNDFCNRDISIIIEYTKNTD